MNKLERFASPLSEIVYYCCLRGTSSSSVNTPWQSLGWRKTTGLPWAPILGGLSGVIPCACRCLTMASRSST